MNKADKTKRSKLAHRRKKSGIRHARVSAAPPENHGNNGETSSNQEKAEPNDSDTGYDTCTEPDFDPYDPTIALYSYAKIAHVGQMLSAHDSDASGVVTIDELVKLADENEKEIIQEIAESEK
eukprot:gene26724-32293_t